MFGKINWAEMPELDLNTIEESAKVAWVAATNPALVGAPKYKPLSYCGWQMANGMNYIFIAEQSVAISPPVRRVVVVVINNNQIAHVEEILE